MTIRPLRRPDWIFRLTERSRTAARERGSVSAEYAIATMAAVTFAGVLVAVVRSPEVRGMLTDLLRQALGAQ